MDNIKIAKMILKNYVDIFVDDSLKSDLAVLFTLFEKRFVLFCGNRYSKVSICVLDEMNFDYPHIMYDEIYIEMGYGLPEGSYRAVCLYEQNSVIASIQTYEEKIADAIERLISLMTLTPLEVEHEFQKEFMFYWDSVTSNKKIELYIGRVESFTKLKVYQKNDQICCVAPSVLFNDSSKENEKWEKKENCVAYYIPIIDCRGILPPNQGHHWGIEEIQNIIFGKRISHISRDTFLKIKKERVDVQEIDLVFEMNCNNIPVTFMIRINCNDDESKTLYEKLMDSVVSIQELNSKRNDYFELNRKIGNECNVMDKNVLLIGAGSLGSYVANELVKNGFNKIKVYDEDELYKENIMRWAYGGMFDGVKKVEILKFFLERNHPEIRIEAIGKNIDEKDLLKEVLQTDLIIFTVGSTDIQMKMNKVLKDNHCHAPVIFVWLEAGGLYSHILVVDYKKKGCFECLYTDETGSFINNKANQNTEEFLEQKVLRNGCGGTRAAYGTAVLLRTTAVLLEILKQIYDDSILDNTLVNISLNEVEYVKHTFVVKGCRCCGDRDFK